MIAYYPNLAAEIAKRKIKKKTIADTLGINDKTLRNKLSGKNPLTWPEARKIRHIWFPDLDVDYLFEIAVESKRTI